MLLVKDMEDWKKVVDLSFQFRYKEIQYSEFYKELNPSLQNDLMSHLVKREIRHFPMFFQIQLPDGTVLDYLTNRMIASLISLVECEILPKGRMIITPCSEFKQLFLIRKGSVKMFDSNYNYLCQLREGSFFGEYQVLFGLYSDFFYSTNSICYIFKMESIDFMKTICRDDLSYKHFF